MKEIVLKKNFLLFIIFLIIFAVFYLYIKHNVGNDSSVSEWLINYNGGFTRRGLGGEIAITIANLFDFSLRQSIFLLRSEALPPRDFSGHSRYTFEGKAKSNFSLCWNNKSESNFGCLLC